MLGSGWRCKPPGREQNPLQEPGETVQNPLKGSSQESQQVETANPAALSSWSVDPGFWGNSARQGWGRGMQDTHGGSSTSPTAHWDSVLQESPEGSYGCTQPVTTPQLCG